MLDPTVNPSEPVADMAHGHIFEGPTRIAADGSVRPARHGPACLFVRHDLAVVRHMAHRATVLYRGRVVEQGPALAVLDAPRHPYTAQLTGARAAAADAPEPPRTKFSEVADACAFAPRCPMARPDCTREVPRLRVLAPDHLAACHHA